MYKFRKLLNIEIPKEESDLKLTSILEWMRQFYNGNGFVSYEFNCEVCEDEYIHKVNDWVGYILYQWENYVLPLEDLTRKSRENIVDTMLLFFLQAKGMTELRLTMKGLSYKKGEDIDTIIWYDEQKECLCYSKSDHINMMYDNLDDFLKSLGVIAE